MLGEERQPGFRDWLTRPAVKFNDTSADCADLILLALQSGVWQRLEADVQRGVALEALDLPPISAADLKAAATQFRYDRGLISAHDFTSWMSARSLEVSDISGVLRRRLLRDREQGRGLGDRAPDIRAVLWAETMSSGILGQVARAVAQRLAAAQLVGDADLRPPKAESEAQTEREAADAVVGSALEAASTGLSELSEDDLRSRILRLGRLDRCLRRLHAKVARREAVQRCLAGHQLDWLTVLGDELALASDSAAREARLLVVADGLGLASVAERARAKVAPRRMVLDEVPQEASLAVIAAAPGELAGPWLEDGRWRVMLVQSKSPPKLEDPALCQRAERELMRGVLERAMAGKVEWVMAL